MSEPTYNRDDNVKHLELIQAVIARLATNSFLIKGWTVTLTAALYGFGASARKWQITAIALFVVLAFWVLDAYFLRLERLFRAHYEQVARQHRFQPRFSMSIAEYSPSCRLHQAVISPTLLVFYGSVLAVSVGITVVLLVIR